MADISTPYIAKFEEFISSRYRKDLDKLADEFPEKRSLHLDYKVLETFDIDLADSLIENPYTIIDSAKEAIKNLKIISPSGTEVTPEVRFYNLPKEHNALIRDIGSSMINKFISVNGLVNKITEVKPKMVLGVFECNHCGRIYNIPQSDESLKLSEPGVCTCDRKSYSLLVDQSRFMDTQKLEMQEPLEITKGGDQSRKITVFVEDDLTNDIVAGNKIEVTGVLRLQQPKFKKSVYDLFIDTNNFIKVEKEFEELDLTDEDIKEILELANDPKFYQKLVNSIAPSIYGHREIKEAIALQLFGGTAGKITPDGMKIRPDTHILLIGDPGIAKSRLLHYVSMLTPKGVYVSGKGSSAAGLTATAEKDDFGEGGWTLKAGALVLAAGGMAMIDEFDKMSPEDRSSMHDAMESQEIHVAKAGIVTTFKANTAILAAANPKYGRFDPYDSPVSQFNIPPTIMSRFDLIFPMRDVLDAKKDRELAEHILKTHFNALHKDQKDDYAALVPIIEPDLLRKYIAYARKNFKPALTEEAMMKIKTFYLDLRRTGEKQGAVPITPRYLEGIVRLAEASAKGRLSNTVDLEDAARSIRLLTYSLKETGIDPETGRMDIDIITFGTAKSRIDKIRSVLRIIKKLNTEYQEASHEAILEEAKKQNINTEELEDLISQLQKNGDIYSPKYGVFKPTGEK